MIPVLRISPLFLSALPLAAVVPLIPGMAYGVFAAPNGPAGPATASLLTGRVPDIDGDVRDWPRPFPASHMLQGPDGPAQFALSYDANNLYVVVVVADKSPLKNSSPRPEEALKGGDAIALYLGGARGQNQRVLLTERAGKEEVTVYRPTSREKKPYTFTSPVGEVTFDYVAPLTGATVAFRRSDSGYVAEAALPWKSLGLNAGTENLPFDLQVIYSDPSGSTNAAMGWWAGKGSQGDTVEDLPTEAKLYPQSWGQLALTAAGAAAVAPQKEGGALAPPARLAPQGPGDAEGVPLELSLPRAGRVSLVIEDQSGFIVRELLLAEKMEAGKRRVLWNGRDRYDEVLPPGKYRWRALLFDGMSTRFMGSVGNSGRPPHRTEDGLGSMGGQHGVPTMVAADAGGVYLSNGLEEGTPALRKIDARTGAALWKRSAGGFGMAAGLASNGTEAFFLNVTGSRKGRSLDLVRIDPATGRDVNMGQGRSRVQLAFLEPGKTEEGGEEGTQAKASLPRISGTALAGKRAYFAVPGQNRLGGVDLETGALLPDISLPAPEGLTLWDANNLLVCSGNAVLRVEAATGKSTPVLQNLTAPRAAVRAPDGTLYVSELGAKQQISVFGPDGKLKTSWGRPGGKPRTMHPYDPMALENITAIAFGPDGNLWLCESATMPKRFVKVSTAGKWLEDFYGPVAYNTFGPDLSDVSTVYYNPGGNEGSTRVIRTKLDYARYAANPSDPVAGWKIEAVYDLALGKDGKSVNSVMGDVARTGYGHYMVFPGTNGKKYLFRPSKGNRASVPLGAGIWLWEDNRFIPCAFLPRDERGGKAWADANGDGLIQPEEEYQAPHTQELAFLAPDLSAQGLRGALTPASIDARGVPRYEAGKFTPYFPDGKLPFEPGWTFVSHQKDRAVYYSLNLGPQRKLSAWDRASENQIVKVQGGKVQWIVGQHEAKPEFIGLSTVSGISGVVDDLLLVQNVEPATYVAFTTDGFNLGNVIADAEGKRVRGFGPNSITIESFTGLFAKDPASGKRLLFAVSSGDNRILEVTGPGQTTRLQGEINLQSSRPRPVSGNSAVVPYETWYGNVGRGQGADGDPSEWLPGGSGISIVEGNVAVGEARLRRDAGALAVLATVLQSGPLKEGEGIELELAPAEAGPVAKLFLTMVPHPKQGRVGQARLEIDGKTVAAKGAKVGAKERWQGLGYRLEAEIPLDLLPAVSAPRKQTFARPDKEGTQIKRTETLPDLVENFRLKATIVRQGAGGPVRISAPAQGYLQATAP